MCRCPSAEPSLDLIVWTADWKKLSADKFILSVISISLDYVFLAEQQLYFGRFFLPLYVLMQLHRPFPGWCDLLWPSGAKTAVLFSLRLAVLKLPVQCRTSTPDEEREVLLWTACAHTRRQDWITDCFVGDRETLWVKVSREKECRGIASGRWDTVMKTEGLSTNILLVRWRFTWRGEEVKAGKWGERVSTWPADELCVCEGSSGT